MGFDPRRFHPELWPALEALTIVDLVEIDRLRAESAATNLDWNPSVEIVDITIPVGDEGSNVVVRVYRNKERRYRAAILHIHGGGFVLGDLEFEHRRCMQLATEGECLVASVDYRLAPEHPYPSALDDCLVALMWLHEKATELGVDINRIGVAGSSAGACIAAGLAMRARDQGGPPLAFQLLVYPVTDSRLTTPSIRTFWDGPGFSGKNAADMWTMYVPSGLPDQYASPALAENLTGLPQTFVSIAEFDPLRDEGIEFARRMLDAGVAVELRVFPGTWHGFDLVAPDTEIAKAFNGAEIDAVLRFIRSDVTVAEVG
jgi:acetyl esterase